MQFVFFGAHIWYNADRLEKIWGDAEMSANKILIADDDRVVHESLSIYLKAEGYEVVDAYNGAEALEKLDAEIALCVLDIMMPVMSGIEACKEIRKNSSIPIIMLTALSQLNDKVKGFDTGVDDYLCKPGRHMNIICGDVLPYITTFKY